ncbi:hypothetical protein ANN_13264 [Periplaneta americana]|uniref:Uncharacterized protein n=1 Tax=Periplaneta americana TaxID=6978 RepID=A0ABQ8TLG6_PERAM|nr:hypothetical protein ANN_13264 [Periplaneta americana]
MTRVQDDPPRAQSPKMWTKFDNLCIKIVTSASGKLLTYYAGGFRGDSGGGDGGGGGGDDDDDDDDDYDYDELFISRASSKVDPNECIPDDLFHLHRMRISCVSCNWYIRKESMEPANKTTSSTSMPVISNVTSLATPNGQQVPNQNSGITTRSAALKVNNNNIPTPQAAKTPPVMYKQQVIVKPPHPKQMKNKSILCKPYMHTKGVSCRPHPCTKETQTVSNTRERSAIYLSMFAEDFWQTIVMAHHTFFKAIMKAVHYSLRIHHQG